MRKKNKIISFLLCFILVSILSADTVQGMQITAIKNGNVNLLGSGIAEKYDNASENTTDIPDSGNEEEPEDPEEEIEEDEPPLEDETVEDVENLEAVQNKKSIILTWDESYEAEGYLVERKTTGGEYKQIAKLSSAQLTYTDKNISYQKKYTYRIKSYFGETVSDGVTVSITAKLPKPNLTVKRQGTSGKLTWKSIDGSKGYVIYMATSKNGSYKKIKTISSAKTTTYTKKNLSEKKSYYFKIRAYVKIDGKNIYSSYSSVAVMETSLKNKIKSKFIKLQIEYPDGKYWNHKGKSTKGKDISTMVTSKPCSLHTSSWASSCNYYYCPDGTIGYQCHGFAWKMSDLIFGKNAPVKRFTDFNKAKVGDVVRIRGVHTIIIIEKHKDYVLAGEANVGGTCMIRWGRTYTKNDLSNSVYYTRY